MASTRTLRGTSKALGAVGVLLVLTGLVGCGSTEEAPEPKPEPGLDGVVPRPSSAPIEWTQAFQAEAVLIANKITIEGPADLLDHVVIRQEPGIVDVVQETTTDGLLQRMTRRPEAGAGEIRAWIDQWSLAALQEIVVLQRPGEVPVRILAEGNAAFLPTDGSSEIRRARIEFSGERGK